jgi:hypothetical protein
MNSTTSLVLPETHIRIQWLLTVVGGIGIPAIVLDFAWSTSPLAAAPDRDLWRLAWPFFLPILVTLGSLHWLVSTRLSRTERMVAYLASTIMVCVMLSMYLTLNEWPDKLGERLGIILPIVILGVGAVALFRTRHNEIFRPVRALMSMQVAYSANCVLCLSTLFGMWQIGAYCSLVTIVAYFSQTFLAWRNSGGRSEEASE